VHGGGGAVPVLDRAVQRGHVHVEFAHRREVATGRLPIVTYRHGGRASGALLLVGDTGPSRRHGLPRFSGECCHALEHTQFRPTSSINRTTPSVCPFSGEQLTVHIMARPLRLTALT
jgi:hypothetical protein